MDLEELDERKLAFTRSFTLGGMIQERAAGPQGQDVRFLHVDAGGLPRIPAPAGEDRSVVLGYAEVYDLACRAASCYRRHGVKPGDRVLLFLSTGPAFLATFYGCQLAGAVAVPIAPPRTLSQIEGHLVRVARVCEPALTVVDRKFMPLLRLARGRVPEVRAALASVVEDLELLLEEPTLTEPHPVRPSDPALLQFTSGSTGAPKGVTLSHTNLFANIRAIGVASGFQDGDLALSWLPLFHDMGLIGHMLTSALWRVALVLMPPEVFVGRPSSWLEALSRYRAAHSTAPNFAYLLCARKVVDRDLAGIDLSRWRVAYCGAEPIHPDTIRRFTDRFERCGFRATSFFPCYGLAEFSLAAAFPEAGAPPRYDRIARGSFERDGVARACDAAARDGEVVELVSVGRAVPGHALRVVGADGAPVAERRVGEIEVSGPSMMLGYYRAPETTAQVIRDGWLRTGDLGYIAEGELFVAGRSKDLVIKAGRNIHPQDVEHAASAVEGVRAGCCAAFAVTDERRGVEELVLLCETKGDDPRRHPRLRDEIRVTVRDAVGVAPDVVALVKPGAVLKTSSGKIRRQEMRERYLRNDLEPERLSQGTRARLLLGATLDRLRRGSARLKRVTIRTTAAAKGAGPSGAPER